MQRRLIPAAILLAYGAVLVRVLVFKNLAFNVGRLRFRISARSDQANLVPFRTIGEYLHGGHGRLIGLVNLIGNVALFVPIGVLAPIVLRGMGWRAALVLALAAGLTVEGLQALLHVGEFDIDDVILNALGVTIGFGAHAFATRRKRRGR
jgi:glycopeptide antibiotics resistance protein